MCPIRPVCSCNQHELQVTAAEKRAARKATLEKIRSDAMETCLTAPFVEAAVANAMPTCISLALAWQSYTELLYSQVIRPSFARTHLLHHDLQGPHPAHARASTGIARLRPAARPCCSPA